MSLCDRVAHRQSGDALRAWKLAHLRPLAERFWEKVNKTNSCWLWTGAVSSWGYGQIAADYPNPGHKRLSATRVSLELHGISVPSGAHICHHCDVPACVRPDHLFVGDAKANIQDCIAKGRFKFAPPRPGESNNQAKMTALGVIQMRMAFDTGASISELSRRFQLARSSVREIVQGRTWRHI